MPTIGVAIPCYKPHHSHLYRLIDSIAGQTHRPDKVVVSCSSWDIDATKHHIYDGIPITIVYSKRVIFQAENRNIAAGLLATDLISFIDADDVMHPRRLEYVLRAFQEASCDAVVHNYQYISAPEPYTNEDEFSFCRSKVMKNPTHLGCITEGEEALHHAHVTVTKDVFAKFQYPIDPGYYRIEDAVYLGWLVEQGVNVRYISNKLSQYFH